MPVVFVHGITVREDRFNSLLDDVRDGLKEAKSPLPVEGCYWGDLGSTVGRRLLSIPGVAAGARDIAEARVAATAATVEAQLLALLLDHPTLELVMLRDPQGLDPDGLERIPKSVEERDITLHAAAPRIAVALEQDPVIRANVQGRLTADAATRIVTEAYRHATRTDRALTAADLIDPLTRCLTAALYRETADPADTLDSTFSWTAVDAAVQALLERELGGDRSLRSFAKDRALSTFTFALRHGLRERLMGGMAVFMGDVFVYLAKREEILGQLAAKVEAAVRADPDNPLWLIGHSLGGIICYDYCCRTALAVERLVTVGSQVGMFAELGAIAIGAPRQNGKIETAPKIGAWINIYDLDDVLSFVAQPIFTRVQDIEVDTDAPFPISHSEYWKRGDVFAKLVQNLS